MSSCHTWPVVRLRLCLLAQGTITVLDRARIYHYKRHIWGGGQILKRWFVIGTASRNAARKLVKNFKICKNWVGRWRIR